MSNMTPEREKLINIALQCEGLGASTDINKFAELMGLEGAYKDGLKVPFSCKLVNGKWQTKGVSTCGLVAEGIWHSAGISIPSKWRPYTFGSITRAITFAKKQPRSAWQTPIDGLLPEPGDCVVIGSGTSEHVFTVVDWEDDNVCISIDGGQTDKRGLQCIKKCRREWKDFMVGNRKVLGWTCIDLLPWNIII